MATKHIPSFEEFLNENYTTSQRVNEAYQTLAQSMVNYKEDAGIEDDEEDDEFEDMKQAESATVNHFGVSSDRILSLGSPVTTHNFPFDMVPGLFDEEQKSQKIYMIDSSIATKKLFGVSGHPGSFHVEAGKLPNGTDFVIWDGANWDGPFVYIKK